MTEKEEKFPIFFINNCSSYSENNLNIKNNVYAIPVLCFELIGWLVYEEIGYSAIGADVGATILNNLRNSFNSSTSELRRIRESMSVTPSDPNLVISTDHSIHPILERYSEFERDSEFEREYNSAFYNHLAQTPYSGISQSFTGFVLSENISVTCPCGVTVNYQTFPRVDTPMPCGNPNHFVVRYTNTYIEDIVN